MRLGLHTLSVSGLMVLLGTLAIVVAGCGTSTSNNILPDSQQIIRLPINANAVDIKTMDPAMAGDFSSYLPIELVFPGLLVLDNNGNLIPWAATSLPTYDPTTDTYAFTIRSGLKWSDGTAIDATTFAYSINRALSPCTASPLAYTLYPINYAKAFNTNKQITCSQGVSAAKPSSSGTSQVQSTFSTAQGGCSSSPTTLIGCSIIVPDSTHLYITVHDGRGGAVASAEPGSGATSPLTTLATAYDSSTLGTEVHDRQPLVDNAFPYFLEALCYPPALAQPQQLIAQYGNKTWTDHLADNGGFGGNLYKVLTWDHKGHLDLVRNAAFWGTAPKLREADFKIYPSVDAEYADYLDGRLDQGIAPLTQYSAAKARSDFHQVIFLEINYYQPNWAKPPFDDPRVRQAFDLALNKDKLARILQNSVIATNHIVPQGMPGFNPGLIGPDGTNGTAGNVAKATSLMQDYANDKCGRNISNCTPVTLVDSNDPSVVTYDQAAVQMWQTAFPGLQIKTQFGNFTNIPQIYGAGWIADYPDPEDWLSLQFGTYAINNFGSVNDSVATALMAAADDELDSTKRIQDYNQAEQQLVTDGAWIPTSQSQTYYNLQGYVMNFMVPAVGLVSLPDWQSIYLTVH